MNIFGVLNIFFLNRSTPIPLKKFLVMYITCKLCSICIISENYYIIYIIEKSVVFLEININFENKKNYIIYLLI